jgi:hypothetical protein
MGRFRRGRTQAGGYEDNAALKGIGGYQPADTPATIQPAPAPPVSAPQVEAGPHRPRRRKSRAGVGLLVILLLLLLAYVGKRAGDTAHDTGARGSSATRSWTPPPPRPSVVVPVAVAGWQAVPAGDGSYAYDVPASWVAKPGTIHGWEADATGAGLTLATSAFAGQGYCPADKDRDRSGSGVSAVAQADPVRAAEQLARDVARLAYTPASGPQPAIAIDPPELTQVPLAGPRAAILTVAEVTPPGTGGECLPPRGLVGVLAMSPADAGGKSPAVVVYTDQGVPGATSREELVRILRSFRGVPEKDRTTVTPTP